MADPTDASTPRSSVTQALLDAEDAARQGDRERAYQLSLKANRAAPDNLRTWLMCAETAPSVEEAVACLNRANALQPTDPETKQKTYQVVQKLLERDPFLLYLYETDDLYHVQNSQELSLVVPKDRSRPEAYPAEIPVLMQKAYRWLWLAVFGLLLAGLGAIVFAPLAAVSAIRLNMELPSKSHRIHSLMVVILAACVWLVGLLLSVILLVHSVAT